VLRFQRLATCAIHLYLSACLSSSLVISCVRRCLAVGRSTGTKREPSTQFVGFFCCARPLCLFVYPVPITVGHGSGPSMGWVGSGPITWVRWTIIGACYLTLPYLRGGWLRVLDAQPEIWIACRGERLYQFCLFVRFFVFELWARMRQTDGRATRYRQTGRYSIYLPRGGGRKAE